MTRAVGGVQGREERGRGARGRGGRPTARRGRARRRRLAGSIALLALAGALPLAASWPGPNPARAQSPDAAICGGAVECLDQGWNDRQRAWWYTVSQGSRLLPLSWALALEVPGGGERLFGAASMARYGYLANPASVENPHGLPVGFAVDHDPTRDADLMCDTFPETCDERVMREPWLGMNCAACHTNEIEFDGRRVRVEGAPTLADFDGLTGDVLAALRATREDEDRLERFARAVLGVGFDFEGLASVERQLDEQIAWMALLEAKNGTDMPAGHGRLDAQGHILNKVSLVIGAEDQLPAIKSEAPASYPFIWNTHQQDHIQWNGIASNQGSIPLLSRDTDLGALIRNTSEVIGVFAHVEAGEGSALLRGYDSSVRVREMIGLERLLATLQSPRWPEDVLGPLDQDLVARGETLFGRDCARCHAHLEPDDLTSDAGEQMHKVTDRGSGTDIFLACNTFLHTSKAGNTEGQRPRVFPFTEGDKIKAVDSTHLMLAHVAIGSVRHKLAELTEALFSDVEPQPGFATASLRAGEYLPEIADPEKRERARACLTASVLPDDEMRHYKARPLNGIWATAPYLHNGSVPTLYDLLLPSRLRNPTEPVPTETADATDTTAGTAEEVLDAIVGGGAEASEAEAGGPTRPERFGVGSRAFDPEKVGFSTDEATSPTVFEVRDAQGRPIPGNFNSGHDYGNAALSHEDRMALVEYMKSL